MADHERITTAPDPRDLPGPFHHRVTVDVRFADTDAMGHVNNAVYLTYCEMARIRYWTDVTGEPVAAGHEGAESLILAEARITYRAPVFQRRDVGGSCFDASEGQVALLHVTIETRASRVGTSRFPLEHRLTACPPGGTPRLVAVSDSVMVRYDYTTERPTPLDATFVAAIEAYEGRRLRDGAQLR